MEIKNSHYFYVLLCQDKSFYAGYARNVISRLNEHNEGIGCKYTLPRRPVRLLHFEEFETRSLAMKAEFAFKQLSRKQKEHYLEGRHQVENTIISSV